MDKEVYQMDLSWEEEFDAKLPAIYQETVDEFIDRIIINIKRIISKMKHDGKQIKRFLITEARRISLPKKLKQIRADLEKQKDDKKTTVEMIDYNRFVRYYKGQASKINAALDKLSNLDRYKSREAFKKDVEIAEDLIDDFDAELKSIENTPKKYYITDAIDFVDSEILGDSKVYASFIGVCDRLEAASISIERYLKDSRAYSTEYLEHHHVNFISRLLNKFTSALSKHLSKLIAILVFKFN